jgi:signal transduction histidine kinase
MTTRSTFGTVLRNVRQFVLGPWTYHVGALWSFISILVIGVEWRLVGPLPILSVDGSLSARIATILVSGLVGPGFVLVPLLIYKRFRRRWANSPVGSFEYLFTLAVACIIGAAIMDFALRFEPIAREILNEPQIGDTAIRVFVLLLLMNGVIGTLFARIQRESTTAKDALQTVVTQRRLLLESEERVRGQVAAYLHDRVQTDIVSIALRIRATIGQSPDTMNSELTAVISDLERLRSQEVRKASRQLSPNFANVSFDSALRDLSESYRPAMEVSIDVHGSVSLRIEQYDDNSRGTGIYRICEQGLLNAAVHGHATECSIQVMLTARDELVLHLTDNGIGIQGETVQQGMGLSVISAWVETLGGHWSLDRGDSGMTLTATVPALPGIDLPVVRRG